MRVSTKTPFSAHPFRFMAAIVCAVVLTPLASTPATASASEPNGMIGVFATAFDPRSGDQTVQQVYQTGLQGISDTYFTQKGGICVMLMADLTKPNAIAPKVNFHPDATCFAREYGPTLTTSSPSAKVLHIDGIFKSIAIQGDVTTPTAAGSYADPCIKLSFDIGISTDVALGANSFTVGKVTATVKNPSKIAVCNAAGSIESLVNSISAYFGGPNFIAEAQHTIDNYKTSLALNEVFSNVRQTMSAKVAQYATQPTLVNTNGNLSFVVQAKETPPVLTGKLTGTLYDDDKLPCSEFSLKATYETESAMVVDPFADTPKFLPPPLTTTTVPVTYQPLKEITSNTTAHYGCAFTATKLPLEYLASFDMTSPQGSSLTYSPYQWSGSETIPASSSGDFIVGEPSSPVWKSVSSGVGQCNFTGVAAWACKPKKGLQKS